MPHAHTEHHLESTETIRDIVIGMSDGLTVPFALAAGLSGAHVQTRVVVLAGLAEIAAGCIAMGLGGYLAAQTDAEHYQNEFEREERETVELPEVETAEVADVFREWGLTDQQIQPIVHAITSDRRRWVDFMMKFELGLDPPTPGRAITSAVTIGLSYIAGGLIPLSPYFFATELNGAFLESVVVTVTALVIFGGIKARVTGIPVMRGAGQTAIIGGLAAGAAFLIARIFR